MEIVRTGRWRYDEGVDLPVDIVGLPYDFWYELGEADGVIEPGEVPTELGSDGLLYYFRHVHAGRTSTPTRPDSYGYPTVDEAADAAGERLPSPIVWD